MVSAAIEQIFDMRRYTKLTPAESRDRERVYEF